MKLAAQGLILLFLSGSVIAQSVSPFPPQITHVVVIFQENRTPDNLFHFLSPLCPLNGTGLNACIPTVSTSCYNVSTCGLSNASGTPVPITLTATGLAGTADPGHSHQNFEDMCDPDPITLKCRNDGAWHILPNNGSYAYVDNPTVAYNNAYGMGTTTALGPYLAFAQQYGWANFMYQTNQGPSYPAHQYIFSATSAMTAADDAAAKFVAENFRTTDSSKTKAGCLATPTVAYNKIVSPNPSGVCPSGCTCYDNNTVKECMVTNNAQGTTFCYGHDSVATLLPPIATGPSWRYYTPSQGSIWTAPDSFSALCNPIQGGLCTGSAFSGLDPNVVIPERQVLTDIRDNCKLAPVTWIIPDDRWSDHAGGMQDGTGPSWVAAIVNTIGGFQNTCGFWQNTAIIVTWDDWGGWSDNQPAKLLTLPCTPTNDCQGDYQYGFRVPLMVISAYTPEKYINNAPHDFGSIVRMIESINGIAEGQLNFADARAITDLHAFFTLTTPRPFVVVPAVKDPNYFINFTGAAIAPDDDDP